MLVSNTAGSQIILILRRDLTCWDQNDHGKKQTNHNLCVKVQKMKEKKDKETTEFEALKLTF